MNRITVRTTVAALAGLISCGAHSDAKTERSDAEEAEVARRVELIDAEVAAGHAPFWAGEYAHGDGLGFNLHLRIAPHGGFIYHWTGCLGTYDRNYGSVDVRADRVVLEPLLPVANDDAPVRLPTAFVPVRWDERVYLVGEDQFEDFANAINAGYLRCDGSCPGFFVRAGDETKRARGLPQLPAKYRALLLEQPIEPRVSRVLGSSVLRIPAAIPERTVRTVTVEIDAGRDHGVWPGMDFYDPTRGVVVTYRATEVRGRTSVLELRDDSFLEETGPRAGIRLTTKPTLR